MQWALEADPGRLTASFPTEDNAEEAIRRATLPIMERPGIPLPRVLVRDEPGKLWRVWWSDERFAAHD